MMSRGQSIGAALAVALVAGGLGSATPAQADEEFLRCEFWPRIDDDDGTIFTAEVWAFPKRDFSGYLQRFDGGGLDKLEGQISFPGVSGGSQNVLLRAHDSVSLQFFVHAESSARFQECDVHAGGPDARDGDDACGKETVVEHSGYLYRKGIRTRGAKLLGKLNCKATGKGLVSLDIGDGDKVAAKDDDADKGILDGKDVKILDKDGKEVPPLIDADKRAEGDDAAKDPRSPGGSLSDLLGGDASPTVEPKKDGGGSLAALLKGGETPDPATPKAPDTPIVGREKDGAEAAKDDRDKSISDLTLGDDDASDKKPKPLSDLTEGDGGDAAAVASVDGDAGGDGEKVALGSPEKSDVPKKRPARAAAAGAALPGLSTGEVCEIADHKSRFALLNTPARGFSNKVSAIFAGLRSAKTEAPGYEVDTVTSEVFETDKVLSLGPTAELIIGYKVQGRGAQTEEAGDKPEAFVSFEDLGRDGDAPVENVDFSLPSVNVMVFGGASETAYSGLAAVEKFMKGAGSEYRLNIEYYKLLRNGEFAAPKTFSSFKSLILSTEPYRGNPPWVNLRGDQFAPYLDAMAARIDATALKRVDEIIVLKGPYSLPADAVASTKAFLGKLEGSEKINTEYKYLSVIGARGTDFSHGYLAQPVTEFKPGTFYYEPEGVNAKRAREGKPPQLLAVGDQTKLGQEFDSRSKLTVREFGAADVPVGKFVVRSVDVFDTMGLAVSIDALEEMSLKASGLLSLYAEVAGEGAATGKRLIDHRKLPRRTSLIDAISPTEGGLSARYVTPDWLSKPIIAMDAGQTNDAFQKLDAFKGLIGQVLATVEARNCGLIYIPLNADYSAIGAAR